MHPHRALTNLLRLQLIGDGPPNELCNVILARTGHKGQLQPWRGSLVLSRDLHDAEKGHCWTCAFGPGPHERHAPLFRSLLLRPLIVAFRRPDLQLQETLLAGAVEDATHLWRFVVLVHLHHLGAVPHEEDAEEAASQVRDVIVLHAA